MFVARKDLDWRSGRFAASLATAASRFFFNAATSSGVADFGFFGRGVWIDMPQVVGASQPRWAATFSSPGSRAMKAATFALVHKPPSSGGSLSEHAVYREPLASTRLPSRHRVDVGHPRIPAPPDCSGRQAARSSAARTKSARPLRRRCGPWREARPSENAGPDTRHCSEHTDHATPRRSNAQISSSRLASSDS